VDVVTSLLGSWSMERFGDTESMQLLLQLLHEETILVQQSW